MPYLNTQRIRQWLTEQDTTVRRLAESAGMSSGTLKNNVGGWAQIRWGRVKTLAAITGIPIRSIVRAGTDIPPWVLTGGDDEKQEGVKEEKTHPDRRDDGKGGKGPKRAKGVAA